MLDSEKSDEHHSLAVPAGPRDPDQPPDKHSRTGDANLAMRWIKVIIAILWLLAPAECAMAQGLDALAYETIEPSRIKLGESATIRVTSFGHLKDVALPTVPGLVFEALGRSQGLEFVNGTAIPATFILIRVTPQFAGVFSIPGLTPKSRSIGLEVVKGDEPNPYIWHSQQPAPPPVRAASLPKGVQLQAGGAAFVHLAIPTRPIYVGESVPVDIEVGLRPGIVTSVNGLPTLNGSDFTLNNLSKQPERREEAIEGGTFVVLTWHSALAAVKPGDFSLSVETPLTVKFSTLSAADRAVASRLAWPLLQSMYNGVAPKDITIESAPSKLKVLPLPTEGQPKDFSGAVGEFQVSSDISPASVAAGDPLTLRLHIQRCRQLRSRRFNDVRSSRSLENLPREVLLHPERCGRKQRREGVRTTTDRGATGRAVNSRTRVQLFQSQYATLRACADAPDQGDDRCLAGQRLTQCPNGAPRDGAYAGLAPRSPVRAILGE